MADYMQIRTLDHRLHANKLNASYSPILPPYLHRIGRLGLMTDASGDLFDSEIVFATSENSGAGR